MELREACKNHFHLHRYLSNSRVPNCTPKTSHQALEREAALKPRVAICPQVS